MRSFAIWSTVTNIAAGVNTAEVYAVGIVAAEASTRSAADIALNTAISDLAAAVAAEFDSVNAALAACGC